MSYGPSMPNFKQSVIIGIVAAKVLENPRLGAGIGEFAQLFVAEAVKHAKEHPEQWEAVVRCYTSPSAKPHA